MRMEEEERECRMHALHRVYQPSDRTREPESLRRFTLLGYHWTGTKARRYGLHASLVLVPLQDVR